MITNDAYTDYSSQYFVLQNNIVLKVFSMYKLIICQIFKKIKNGKMLLA